LSSAKKHDCDLIVMASHGRKGIQRVLLGSETQQVLTHSTIPVLVLR
jgi:nucleotide-binding universal stress UspA family protein